MGAYHQSSCRFACVLFYRDTFKTRLLICRSAPYVPFGFRGFDESKNLKFNKIVFGSIDIVLMTVLIVIGSSAQKGLVFEPTSNLRLKPIIPLEV